MMHTFFFVMPILFFALVESTPSVTPENPRP